MTAGALFYTGTHHPNWLWTWGVPLFVSRRRLAPLKTYRPALAPWALDSGGFSELTMHGAWVTTPRTYADEVRRYARDIGQLSWAATQDWMCDPRTVARTGKSIAEHQQLTTRSYLDLMMLAPDLPWTPVLQGQSEGDYLRHAEQYQAAGIPVFDLPVVGVGSVVSRQHTPEVRDILRRLHHEGLRVHGFGLKKRGLDLSAQYLASADSLAWSFQARRAPPLPGCTHASCSNCILYAKQWRLKMLTIPMVY